MDLRHLRYFISIVECGSLTEASRRLYVAQPALSQRVSDLERELEVQLLVRGRLGVTPTAAGSALYAHARLVMKQIDVARLDVRDKAGKPEGEFVIGLLRSVATLIAAPLFREIRARYPRLTPQIRVGYSDENLRLVRSGQLDIGMHVLGRDSSPATAALSNFDERVFLVGHASVMPPKDSVGIEDFVDVPLLLSTQQPLHQRLVDIAARHEIALSVVGGVEDVPSALQLCTEQSLATLLPELVVKRAPMARGLHAAAVDIPSLTRQLALATTPDVPRSNVSLGIEALIIEQVRAVTGPPRATAA